MPDYRFAEIGYNAYRTYLDENSTAPPSAVMFPALPARSKDAWLAASEAIALAMEQARPDQAHGAAAGAAL